MPAKDLIHDGVRDALKRIGKGHRYGFPGEIYGLQCWLRCWNLIYCHVLRYVACICGYVCRSDIADV